MKSGEHEYWEAMLLQNHRRHSAIYWYEVGGRLGTALSNALAAMSVFARQAGTAIGGLAAGLRAGEQRPGGGPDSPSGARR